MTDFYDRVRAAADAQGRLPLPQQAMWEIFPFEPASLRVRPLEPLVLPEPPRGGEGDQPCWRCSDPEAGVVWSDDRGCSRRWTTSSDCRSRRCWCPASTSTWASSTTTWPPTSAGSPCSSTGP